MKNFIIPNQEDFKSKLDEIIKGGVNNLHFLSDFDRTLTYDLIDGEKVPSVISVLRNEGYLDEDYSRRAKNLFAYYHPHEMDSSLSVEEKKEKMEEWWNTHFNILIEKGLNKKHLRRIAESKKIILRKGVNLFLEKVNEKNIPFVIFSASGCGDAIEMLFKEKGIKYPNIYFLINRFYWDKEGSAVGIKEPIIHSFNKDETVIQETKDVYEKIKNRKNIILLGDSISDIGMVKGFEYDNLIKIGFLGNYNESQIEEYKENYDVILLNDSEFSPIYNDILNPIL